MQKVDIWPRVKNGHAEMDRPTRAHIALSLMRERHRDGLFSSRSGRVWNIIRRDRKLQLSSWTPCSRSTWTHTLTHMAPHTFTQSPWCVCVSWCTFYIILVRAHCRFWPNEVTKRRSGSFLARRPHAGITLHSADGTFWYFGCFFVSLKGENQAPQKLIEFAMCQEKRKVNFMHNRL